MKFPRNEYQANRGNSNRGRNGNPNRGNYQAKSDSRESALDKLVKEIRQKVKDTKKFWSNLPYTACNTDDFTPSGNNDNCWNGEGINR
jgi:glypican 4